MTLREFVGLFLQANSPHAVPLELWDTPIEIGFGQGHEPYAIGEFGELVWSTNPKSVTLRITTKAEAPDVADL